MNAQDGLGELLLLDGARYVSLIDYNSGITLKAVGRPSVGNTEIVRSMMMTLRTLGVVKQDVEDVLLTLKNEYHIIRPAHAKKGTFLYYVLNRQKANLVLSRLKLKEIEAVLEL